MAPSEWKKSNVSSKLKLVQSPLLSRTSSSKIEPVLFYEARNVAINEASDTLLAGPVFERHEESTAIELFYDLFFVANLTTFSNIHEINSTKTLTSYIGFFCVLWFTWCITSLYDIRFVTDSLLARIAKGVHLGVMVGLAISGPKFDTTKVAPQLRVVALVLMASRFVLGLQYLLVQYHIRKYPKSKLPLGLMGGTNFIAGILYLGISFAFKTSAHANRALYVIAGFEMIVNVSISWQWKVLTFKGTHLIQRMTLLTLYILGEGVIDVLKSVAKISQNRHAWKAANIGALCGAIAAIYLLYMLYFDTLNHHHFGSFRQQLWSFLHFPLHVALVLCLSGMAQFVIWQKIMEGFGHFVTQLDPVFGVLDQTQLIHMTPDKFIETIQNAIYDAFQVYKPDDFTSMNTTMTEKLDSLRNVTAEYLAGPTNPTETELFQGLSDIMYTVWNSIMDTYGFKPPEKAQLEAGNADIASIKTVAALKTAQLMFDSFFIATGFTIILIGILGVVSVRSHTKWTWVCFIAHNMFGLAIGLLALLTRGDANASIDLSSTAWPLPIVAIVLLIVLAIHHISWEDHEPKESADKRKNDFLLRSPNSPSLT